MSRECLDVVVVVGAVAVSVARNSSVCLRCALWQRVHNDVKFIMLVLGNESSKEKDRRENEQSNKGRTERQ